MPINFTQLFKDCWNFIRNQRQFSVTFLLILSLSTLTMTWLRQPKAVEITNDAQNAEILTQLPTSQGIVLTLMHMLVGVFITYLGIISIHQISQQKFKGIFSAISLVLPRLLGSLLINTLISLPIFIGLIYLATAILTRMHASVDNISLIPGLFLTSLGAWIFIRFCLAPINYLIEKQNLKDSLKNTFQVGKQKVSNLFFYCLINYLFFGLLSLQIAIFARNELFMLIALLLISFINLFSMVFTYRFYQLFNQKA